MTNLALEQFGGMMPRYGVQRLPNTAAGVTENALLLSGELRPLHAMQVVVDLRSVGHTIERIYRGLYSDGSATWVTFDDSTVDFAKGPLINDAFDRYYWTSENDVPRYNTLQRIDNGDPPYLLCVAAHGVVVGGAQPAAGRGALAVSDSAGSRIPQQRRCLVGAATTIDNSNIPPK